MPTYSTGFALLPDLGELSYNGVVFGTNFHSTVEGHQVYDDAGWVVKWVEYTLRVEGFVIGTTSTDPNMLQMRAALTKSGGILSYQGRGFGGFFRVNVPGSFQQDLNWGPKPKLLSFQPLGSARSAYVRWECTFCLSEATKLGSLTPQPVQFNEESTVSYDEDAYTTYVLRGTLELGLNANNLNADRSLDETVDEYRTYFLNQVAGLFDLDDFRVTRRQFSVSRDKRVLAWEFELQEKAPMGLPAGCTQARGNYNVRDTNDETAPGFARWIATLSATYTVAKGYPRDVAYLAFLSLWNFRMNQSVLGAKRGTVAQQPAAGGTSIISGPALGLTIPQNGPWLDFVYSQDLGNKQAISGQPLFAPMLIHFSFNEGLYNESRSMSFEAAWVIMTDFQSIINASGVWEWPTGPINAQGESVGCIMGAVGNHGCFLDPSAQVVVDLGGP